MHYLTILFEAGDYTVPLGGITLEILPRYGDSIFLPESHARQLSQIVPEVKSTMEFKVRGVLFDLRQESGSPTPKLRIGVTK